VPGKPEASLLLKKIRAGEMPPIRRLIEVSIKPIEPAKTELLAQWVAQGAPEARVEDAGADEDALIMDKDRSFWAFQAPRPASAPALRHRKQVRNPIDALILQKLEPLGLSLSAEADRATLIRRAYLD